MAGKLWRRWWSRSFETLRKPRPSFRPRLEGLECRLAPALTVTGLAVSATEGAPFSGAVANFTDSNTLASPATLSATIDWGDGNTSPADGQTVLIQPNLGGGPGSFAVSGTHTYAEEGSHPIQVIVTDTLTGESAASGYVSQTNLVSNTSSIPAAHTDSNLVNGWGMSFNPGGPFWISDAGTGITSLYDSSGASQGSFTIPTPPGSTASHSSPTGQVFNNTSDFASSAGSSLFLFATKDGTLAAWGGGPVTLVVDDSASHAVFTGLAMDKTTSGNFLYATDARNGVVDVFDGHFNPVTTSGGFPTPGLTAGFGPYGIQNIGGNLYVAFSKRGAAGGFVYEYDASGNLIRQLTSNTLNAPWGVVQAPASFGAFGGDLLVGNFGDGHINAFDPVSGTFLGQLTDQTGAPLVIDGLWDMKFGGGGQSGDPNTLYFTAGPNNETNGLFGSLTATAPGTATVADAALTVTPAPTAGSPTVVQSNSGADTATELTTFESLLGGANNGNNPPPQSTGFRTINWDGVKTDGTDFGGNTTVIDPGHTVGIPLNRFQARGVEFEEVYAVSSDGFASVNPNAAGLFPAFSPNNTFAMFNETTIDLGFVLASAASTTPVPAATSGFGVVFLNVELPNSASVELFNGDTSLGKFFANPTGQAQPSFLGVKFNSPVITRVQITAGTDVLFSFDGKHFSSSSVDDPANGHNLVVTDDFVYGEPQPLTQSPPALFATEGKSFSGVVANFTDANPGAAATDYSASIDWGDGNTSPADQVVSDGNGGFNVQGSHTYDEEGSHTVKVTITDQGKASTTASASVTVLDAQLTGSPDTITANQNQPIIDNVVARITDADPAGAAGDYSATIDWGDGTTSSADGVVANGNGGFDVLGNHTYSQPGTYSVRVLVEDTDTAVATVFSTATVAPVADLAVSLSGPATAIAGNQLTYTLTLSNNGPSDAQAVSLTDTLPAGETLGTVTQTGGTQFNPNNTGNSISLSADTLPAGASATFSILANVNSDVTDGTVLNNKATATTSTTDTNSSNDSQTASTTVHVQDDLAVTASGPDSAIAGNEITYTVGLSNNGPSDAPSVSLSDTLPAGLTLVSEQQTSGPRFTPGGQGNVAEFSIASLPAGGSASFTILARVNSSVAEGTTLTNTPSVAPGTTDPNSANNSQAVTTTVHAQADLAVTKTGPTTATAGTDITYTITLNNNGPSDAQGVTLADSLPAGETLLSQRQPTGPTFTLGATGNAISDTLATLPAGASATFTVVAHVGANVPDGTMLNNTATASTTTTDPTSGNNSQTASTTVHAQADLALTMKGPTSVIVGNRLTYTLTLTNKGLSDAQAVSLTDKLPSSETFLSQKQTPGSGFTLGHNGNTIQDTLATLPAGASATFTVVASVSPGAAVGKTITNTATARTSTTESTTANNSASSKVKALTNLALKQTASATTVKPGGTITYTVTITNLGSAKVTKLHLVDVLPANTTFEKASIKTLSHSGQAFTFDAGSLAGGHKETVTITVKVKAGTKNRTRLVNTLTIGDFEDHEAVLASSTVTTTVKS
jgi:uncharacterized protein (TIGR03118 family)